MSRPPRGTSDTTDPNTQPIVRLTSKGVVLGEEERRFDSVVLATGFEPGLDDFLTDTDRLLYWNPDMRRRMPLTDGRSRSLPEPSLFFPGFDLSASGGLSLGLWGVETAEAIAREL